MQDQKDLRGNVIFRMTENSKISDQENTEKLSQRNFHVEETFILCYVQ